MQKLSVRNEQVYKEEDLEWAEKAKGSRSASFITAVIIVIFAVSLALSVWILWPSNKQLVEVLSDGEVIYTFDLSKAKDAEYTITYGGSSNTIQIDNGEIRVSEAECPDRTCVEMGKLRSESLPIVCLPNRLTIRFVE